MLDFYNRHGEKIPFKRIVFPIGALFVPSIINKIIFEMAVRSPYKRKKGNLYKSFLGKVNYNVSGKGKKAVFLIHDTFRGGGSWEWDKNKDVLSEKYKVYTIDLPGFGLSEKPWTTFTAYDYTRLIKEFIKDVIKEKCFAIASGNSAAALIHAAFMNPELFEKITVISPSGVNERGIMDDGRRRLFASSVVGTSLYTWAVSKARIRRFMENELFYRKENVTKELAETCHFYAHAEGSRGKHAYASHKAGYFKTGIRKSFEELKVPVLTVWGEEAVSNPVSNMDILEKLCPDNIFAVFEETRALVHYENAHGFNELTEKFFEGEEI